MVQARSPGTVNNGIRYYENILTRATYGPKKEQGEPDDGFKAALEKAANNNPVGMNESSAAHPDRSSGFDFTFTAPRSVSLRLDDFSMYDHRKADIVVEAFEKAVTTTMSGLEGRIEAKVIENSRIVCRPSGNLLYCAHIPHFHAQPMLGRSDVTLHGHAFLVNVTSYRDKWYTVDFLTLASELDRYRILFLEQLAANLEAAGHPTVRAGEGFELQEVDRKRLEKPSRRPVAYMKAAT
jgi:conjugative relaxase-like TrwC/TraI family protein